MAWLWVVLVVVVLGVTAAVAVGRGGAMARAYPDRRDVRLPADRQVTADDLRDVEFSVVLRGYRMDEVDDVIRHLIHELSERDARLARLDLPATHPPDAVSPDPVPADPVPADAVPPDAVPGAAERTGEAQTVGAWPAGADLRLSVRPAVADSRSPLDSGPSVEPAVADSRSPLDSGPSAGPPTPTPADRVPPREPADSGENGARSSGQSVTPPATAGTTEPARPTAPQPATQPRTRPTAAPAAGRPGQGFLLGNVPGRAIGPALGPPVDRRDGPAPASSESRPDDDREDARLWDPAPGEQGGAAGSQPVDRLPSPPGEAAGHPSGER